MASFLASAQGLPAGVTLREECAADREFLADLFASTREDELRAVPWDDAQKRTFLRGQFELQRTHYRQHYPGAEWLVVQADAAAIGRLYTDTGPREVRLMEIALTAERRNNGIGTTITSSMLRYADDLGLPVTLHVEPFNPALRLYERLGFVMRETRGIYLFMERPVSLAAER
jgi:ribosomal protein S18 acetylase RimI-like enzyme